MHAHTVLRLVLLKPNLSSQILAVIESLIDGRL